MKESKKRRQKQPVNLPLARPLMNPLGGGSPLYGLFRYVQPQSVWFFSRFGHKWGIDFGHFGAILI